MTLEETRARNFFDGTRKMVDDIRKTHPSDPESNVKIANTLDSILDFIVQMNSFYQMNSF